MSLSRGTVANVWHVVPEDICCATCSVQRCTLRNSTVFEDDFCSRWTPEDEEDGEY